MVKSNRRIIDLGGDDEFAGSQWASQVASTRKRIRKVKAVHKHISPVSIIKSPGSPAVKQTRQTRVESLLARLAQKKAPRKLPAHRGSPKLPTVVVTRSTERQPKSGRPSKSVSNEPNPFMDIEAEESDGDGAHSGDEEATEDWDQDLSGFVVNDHDTPARSRGSQSAPSTGDLHASPTDMRAFYQKSLLSPSMGGMGQRAHGGYKFAWGRSTPGRRRRPYAETPTRRNDVEEDEEDDSLSGFVVDDEDELSDLHGVKTPGTQSACVSQIENQDDDGEDLFLDSTRDPTHAEVNDGPAAGGWEMDSPLAQKKRSERKLERGTGNDSGSSRGGAIFSNHARSGQTGTDSRRFKDSASAEHDLLADTAGRIDQANALHTVTDDPELDELAQSAIEDSMNIDWEDDQWDYLAETPAKPQTSSSRLVMTPLNTKTPRSNALAANKASPFSPFAMHGPSPLKPIEELTEEQKGVLLVEHDPHAHIHRVQQCVQSKVTILVDTREMRSSICSKLRNIHNVRVEIRQLAFGDYVLSNRIAVERKTRADLLSSVFNKRVYEQISNLKAMCDRPILLIEADEENSESMAATAQYEGIIASLLRMQITVLFSESTDYSAHLLFTLATKEAREGASMDVPDMLPAKNNQAVQFLMSIPGVSDVTAIAIMNSRFKSLREFVNCSPADMVARIPGLSLGRAKKIHNFLQASAVPAKQANDKQDVEFA
ncbi:hypothetical protein DFJ77DRAFT_291125 [Powellomyces hirtus]|nr:hypothetical protein DFJ77DRAFT_291125 [Powellomyces hirtus]